MKFVNKRLMTIALGLLVAILAAAPARAQNPRIEMSQLDRFTDAADKVIDVSIGESIIKLALSALNPQRSPNEAKAKEILEGLKGIYVKRFEFEKEGVYSMADVESIRSQLATPGWERIANVRSKREGNYDVVIMSEGSVVKGLAVLAAEPRAITVVNIIGPIDIAKFREIEGKFGIPNLGLETIPGVTVKDKTKDKQPDENDRQDPTVIEQTVVKRDEKKPPKLIRPEKPPQEQ
jgi:Domain of unknown function (DUF4252)